MFAARIRLRSRMLAGVTSTSSSSLMNSIACSSPSLRGGIRRIASSAVEARMLVCFFSLVTLTSRSFGREFSPMTMPSYTCDPRLEENLAALLQVVDRVGGRRARAIGDQRAGGARRNRAVPRLPAREDVVHDAGALGVGHELRAEADQAARRNPELEPHAAATARGAPRATRGGIGDHFRHDALALADLRDHHALVILGHVDHQLLDRLDGLPAEGLRDDVGARHLQLEALAPHHLDQDRQLQLAAADDLHLLRRIGRLEPDRDVAEQLAIEAVADLAGGHVLAIATGHRRRVDAEDHRHGRLVDGDRRDGDAVLDVGNRLADGDVLDAGQADDVAGRGLLDVDALQAVERVQLGDLRLLDGGVQLAHRDLIADLHAPVEDAADRDPSDVIARIEVGDQQLERRVRVAARRRDVIDDGVEQGPQVQPRDGRVAARRAGSGVRVEHRELELLFGRVEVDEQVVDLVEHFLRTGVGPVDLVDDHDRRQAALERLAQDEARLRQRPFRGVDQQHHAVDHRQRPLHFAAEIGVARRVDDVDQVLAVVDGGVLGENRDAALALEVGVVHRALGDAFVDAKRAALVQQGIDQRRFAVIDVGDDCDVPAERVGDVRAGGGARTRFGGRRHLPSIPVGRPGLGYVGARSTITATLKGSPYVRSLRGLLRRFDAPHVLFVRQRRSVAYQRIARRSIDLVRLGAQVRGHVVADPGSALVAERGDVDRRDDDPLAGAG